MENIKVSVILPVFNEANYIKATLDSIINQNFNDYEVIVIDDGSTDDTLNIVEKTFEGLSALCGRIVQLSLRRGFDSEYVKMKGTARCRLLFLLGMGDCCNL